MTKVAHLARTNQIVERGHYIFRRVSLRQSGEAEQIDVVSAQPLERLSVASIR